MCGRYAVAANPADLVLEFEVVADFTARPTKSLLKSPQVPPPGQPDYNVAPTKQAPVVLSRPLRPEPEAGVPESARGEEPVRQLRLLTWGLVPSWAKTASGGARMINARAESVLDKPAYKTSILRRRALVPATGWYEWQPSPTATDRSGNPRKQPFFTSRADGRTAALAALYDFWRDPAVPDKDDPDAWLVSYAILTTAAEPGLDRIHDRQPLVLDPQDWAEWLDPELCRPDDVRPLLHPREPGRFTAHPVSPAVSSSRANGEQLLLPVPEDELVGVLDPLTGEILGGPQ